MPPIFYSWARVQLLPPFRLHIALVKLDSYVEEDKSIPYNLKLKPGAKGTMTIAGLVRVILDDT